MTCWGFTPDIFLAIEAELSQFIIAHGVESKSECFLPDVVQKSMLKSILDGVIHSKKIRVKMAQESWFGVTYAQDAAWVKQRLSEQLDNDKK